MALDTDLNITLAGFASVRWRRRLKVPAFADQKGVPPDGSGARPGRDAATNAFPLGPTRNVIGL
jgi:hypothetical protein